MRMFWGAGLALILLGAMACANKGAPPPPDEIAGERMPYVIGVSDVLRVTVWKNPDLGVAVVVRPDGMISVPLLDAILGGEAEVPTMTGRIALNIPAGTQNGRSFKIKGRGLPKMNSDQHGDLFATVKVRLPEYLSEEEEKLYAQLRGIGSSGSRNESSSEPKNEDDVE